MDDKHFDIYNDSYRFVTPDFLAPENAAQAERFLQANSESLLNFLKSFFSERGGLDSLHGQDVLETGCGLGGLSLELSKIGAKTMGLDLSSLAVQGARDFARFKGLSSEFECLDITKSPKLQQKFDYIIDSHLLHCLTSQKDRESYFEFVKNHLKPDGVFLVETATYESEIREPLGYDFDQDYNLHQEIGNSFYPVRRLAPTEELEKEIPKNGLKIHTFYYHYELSFNVFPEHKSYPVFRLPKTVRYTAKLARA